MNLIPLRGYCIIEPLKDADTAGGIAIPDSAKEIPQKGKVLKIGLSELVEDKEYPPDFEEGDIVYYGKWQGMDLRLDPASPELKILKFEQVFLRESK